ncbi:MAG: histidinol-phosphate transaminase [Actinobacteria bacterium]|nr:histidinol-phosphate transaminase [Actinomycetota bacterium]
MKIKVNKFVSRLPEYVPGRTIEEIKKKYGLDTVYKMASNENLYGPHPEVIRKIAGDLKKINYYPDSNFVQLREKLSLKHGVPPDMIVAGNGTDQVIELICDAFLETGENAVIADPTFLIYEKYVIKSGGSVIKVPLFSDNLCQDIGGMLGAVNERTRLIFVTIPHNPSGTGITQDEFDYLAANLPERILLVVDEAYHEYVPPEEKIKTIDYITSKDNIITLRTFSKVYGLAGLRIGYGIANKEVIDVLDRVRLPFNVNSIAQKAAVIALENEDYVERIRADIEKEKQKFYGFLDEINVGYIRSHTNFILIKVGRDSKYTVEELLKKGFIVRPGENLGIPGYIRVTMATPGINKNFLDVFMGIHRKKLGGEQ